MEENSQPPKMTKDEFIQKTRSMLQAIMDGYSSNWKDKFDEDDESKPVDKEIRFGSWGQAWTYLLETPLFIMVPLEVHPDYLSQFVDYIAKNEDQFKQEMGSRWERVMKPRWEALLKEKGQRKAPQGDLFG